MEDFSYLLGQHDLNGQVQNHATQLPALPSLSPFESEMFWSQTGAGSDWNGSLEATIDARALENAPGLVEKSGNASNDSHERETSLAPPKKHPRPSKPLPPGSIVTDRSCYRCRDRKVKCNRVFPQCDHCVQRGEKCDLIDWKPKPKKSLHSDPARIKELETRLAELEASIANGTAVASTTSRPLPQLPAYDPASVALARLNQSSAPNFQHLADSPAGDTPNIGAGSLDWRLATPQMASALSQHLCDAFFESCCFLLPTYNYYRTKIPILKGQEWQLSPAAKVAVQAFRAVGARTSNHSALLGITISPDDEKSHPDAPLLSAGQRRQSACMAFLAQAHQACFESSLAEEVSVENLAAILSLMQMSIFVELQPRKSRTLLRSALDQFRDLQDSAPSDAERQQLKSSFGFAIYSADALLAAYASRACAISDTDLKNYFSHMGLVIPKLPDNKLQVVVERLLKEAGTNMGPIATIRHLLHCWVCACQRTYARLFSPPAKPSATISSGIRLLWTAIDQTRATIQHVLAALSTLDPNAFTHEHGPGHSHDSDWAPQIIRLDRDLLDLTNLIHSNVKVSRVGEVIMLLPESTSRVRKGLKALALYAKLYTCGADTHMTYHNLFQMELNPEWTRMALQRVGDVDGPLNVEEEVTETELSWLIEGLQLDCYYTPDAEARLKELSPRFTQIDTAPVTPGWAPSPTALADLPPAPVIPSPFSIDAFLSNEALLSPPFQSSQDSGQAPSRADTYSSLFQGNVSSLLDGDFEGRGEWQAVGDGGGGSRDGGAVKWAEMIGGWGK